MWKPWIGITFGLAVFGGFCVDFYADALYAPALRSQNLGAHDVLVRARPEAAPERGPAVDVAWRERSASGFPVTAPHVVAHRPWLDNQASALLGIRPAAGARD